MRCAVLAVAIVACGGRAGLAVIPPSRDASIPPAGDSASDGASVDRDAGEDAARTEDADAGRAEPSIRIAAGGGVACAVVRGALECWGRNDVGQLGIGSFDSTYGGEGLNPTTLGPASVPGLAPTMVTAGGGDLLQNHVCASDGSHTSCWGNDDYFELGHDPQLDTTCTWSTRCNPTPVPVAGMADVKGIAAGAKDTCAVVGTERTVACWGDNFAFQLAEPHDAMGRDNGGWGTSIPTPIPGLSGIGDVGVGVDSACARAAADGSIWCWGTNEYGQLGTGLSDAGADGSFLDWSPHLPARVEGVSDAVSLSVGRFEACVALADGSVRCWGMNNGPCTQSPGGQLGHAPSLDSMCAAYWLCNPTPTLVAGLPAAREVASGYFESCAVLRDDTVACWGVNQDDNLGHDPSLDLDSGCGAYSCRPTRVVGLSNVAHVALYDLGGCAVTWDDRVLCWGLLSTDADGGSHESASAVEMRGL
jgi:hypothetical protein